MSGKVEALERDNRVLKREAVEASREADERNAALSAMTAALQKDVGDARAKLAPMATELESARSMVNRLSEEVEAAKRGRAEAVAQLERANLALAAQEGYFRDMKAEQAKLLRQVEDERNRSGSLAEAVKAQGEALGVKDREVADLNRRIAEVVNELRGAQEDNAALRREAEAIAGELMSVASVREMEQAKWASQKAEAAEDLRRISEEARSREAAYAADAQRRAEEVIAARRQAEEAVAKAQADTASLSEIVGKMRGDAAASARGWESERAQYERKLNDAGNKLSIATELAAKAESELRATSAALNAELKHLREEAGAAESKHIAMLAAMQAALKDIKREYASSQRELAGLRASLGALAGHVEEADGMQGVTLEQWYEAAKGTFLLLVERVQGERKRADAEHDNVSGTLQQRQQCARTHCCTCLSVSSAKLFTHTHTAVLRFVAPLVSCFVFVQVRGAELKAEELRGRVLMLEEDVSRAEHEAAVAGNKLAEESATSSTRLAAAADKLRAADAVAEELKSELLRLRAQLERANKQNITLQTEAGRMTTELADVQARNAARIASLDEQVGALQASMRTLTAQVEGLSEERSRLAATVEAHAATIEALRKENAELGAEADANAEASRAAIASYSAQVSTLTEGLKAMEKQAKQTQSLLSLVQEQRKALQASNIELRAELDSLYSQSLNGGSSGEGDGM